MRRFRNISGVPVSFDGKNGTIRFLSEEEKTLGEDDGRAVEHGVKDRILAELPVMTEKVIKEGKKGVE